ILGLGLGSLIGGRLSRSKGIHLLALFGIVELSIGLFGAFSLQLFDWVGARTAHFAMTPMILSVLAVIVLPTALMGATLPILAQYVVRHQQSVGRSVGLLYWVNTLGSAAACFLCAMGLMRTLGMHKIVGVAAATNGLVGVSSLLLACGTKVQGPFVRESNHATPNAIGRSAGTYYPFAVL